ncbi:MAG: hypothetical protein ACP5T3_00440 [Candidatus Micrarchaeia archaeon]
MNYKKLAKSLKGKIKKGTCAYCGAETLLLENQNACNFCELIPNNQTNIAAPDSEAIAQMQQAHSLLLSGNTDDAVAAVEEFASKSTNPYLLYVAGRFYLRISDMAYFDVDYALPGFMERNAERREESLRLTAKGKEYLYKAIYAADSVPEPKGDSLLYLKFLSQMLLDRHADAALTMQEFSDKKGGMWNYASMVYETETNSKHALKNLEQSLDREFNALYYLAKYLAKNGSGEEAMKLLKSMPEISTILASGRLLKKLELANQETS